jgi:hypothetical protein
MVASSIAVSMVIAWGAGASGAGALAAGGDEAAGSGETDATGALGPGTGAGAPEQAGRSSEAIAQRQVVRWRKALISIWTLSGTWKERILFAPFFASRRGVGTAKELAAAHPGAYPAVDNHRLAQALPR